MMEVQRSFCAAGREARLQVSASSAQSKMRRAALTKERRFQSTARSWPIYHTIIRSKIEARQDLTFLRSFVISYRYGYHKITRTGDGERARDVPGSAAAAGRYSLFQDGLPWGSPMEPDHPEKSFVQGSNALAFQDRQP
jgi:hypothetical protein